MPRIEFFTPGTPRPQGSKRPVGGGRFIEASKHLKPWRDTMIATARAAHDGPPIEGPVTVYASFIFPRAKALKNKPAPPHTSPSDTDKLQRALGDALEQSGILNNDSQITTWHAHKRRAIPGETPGVKVRIETGEETTTWHRRPTTNTQTTHSNTPHKK